MQQPLITRPAMHLTSLHIALTYECVFERGHCFIWGSPRRCGIFQLERLDAVLDQAAELGTVGELCYQGGETFVYYPSLIAAVRHAAARRLRTAVVTGGYWANSIEQARIWLGRLADAGLERIYFVADSREGAVGPLETHPGMAAAQQIGLLTSVLAMPQQSTGTQTGALAGWPPAYSEQALVHPESGTLENAWASFTTCPYSELVRPSQLYVDPSGDLHVCKGLVIGNVFQRPLAELVAGYAPESHPFIGPLLTGGPAELAMRYGLEPEASYTDACQLCRHIQTLLRSQDAALAKPFQLSGAETERHCRQLKHVAS